LLQPEGVDTCDCTGIVDERSAAVARIDRCVGLDERMPIANVEKACATGSTALNRTEKTSCSKG